jgi:hypothetical protein
MPLTLNDINFHSLTRAEATQLETELEGMYPDMVQTPVQSTAFDGYYENHKYLALAVGAVVFWAYTSHERTAVMIKRRMNTLL